MANKPKKRSDFIQYIGMKNNKLTIIEILDSNKFKKRLVKCLCDCGEIKITSLAAILHNKSPMCATCLKSFRKQNFKKCFKLHMLPEGQSALNRIYKMYIRNATIRNLSFSLKLNEFKNLIEKNCFYCNIEPFVKTNFPKCNGQIIYNGIDRKDNQKGYELDNCLPCCKFCNYMKNNINYKDFLEKIEKIYETNLQRKRINSVTKNSKGK